MLSVLVSRGAYPLIFALAIGAFAAALSAHIPIGIALYGPLTAVAFAILALQLKFPYRRQWSPHGSDVRADLWFITLVQLLLPMLLTTAVALAIATWSHAHWASASWWPHASPIALQVIVMVLMVDFMRYWLHRACHRYDALWRLHEVHHAPKILYSLNSARFHPVEKALHFCLDSVPFLLLGVAPEVMAGYVLLYATNGLFQHSNIRLKAGWLNYVMATAQTHRWHHALDTQPCNFSNTTIVWDWVFGTFFLPKDRALGAVGARGRDDLRSFAAEIAAPFRRRGGPRALSSFRGAVATLISSLSLRAVSRLQLWRLRRLANDPMAHQRRLLGQIMRANRATSFGRRFGFERIQQYADFARQVPVSDYEGLRPWVELEINTGACALTQAAVMRYARTSGTTGQPKDVPLTAPYLKAVKAIHRTATALHYRLRPDAFSGVILAIGGAAQETYLANGKPSGAASGIIAQSTPALLRDKFVAPPSLFSIADSRVKSLLILRLALAAPDITLMATANVSTLLALLDLYAQYHHALIKDVREGGFFLAATVPDAILREVSPRLESFPDRADMLEALARDKEQPTLTDLWPRLRAVATWTCASAGVAIASLRERIATTVDVLELGYVASEFRATVTLGRYAGTGMPTLTTHFFEFVEKNRWDDAQPVFLTLDQIRKGVDYYIIVTNPSGLYRYFINDLVRVRGFFHNTPLLQFRQKGKGVTNITGEKLYETHLVTALNAVLPRFNVLPRFAMLIADEHARQYTLYLESLIAPGVDDGQIALALDARLAQENVEYRCKRDSQRLKPLLLRQVKPGTGESFKQWSAMRGQRESQFKPPLLAYRRDVEFDLESHLQQRQHETAIHSSEAIEHSVRANV